MRMVRKQESLASQMRHGPRLFITATCAVPSSSSSFPASPHTTFCAHTVGCAGSSEATKID